MLYTGPLPYKWQICHGQARLAHLQQEICLKCHSYRKQYITSPSVSSVLHLSRIGLRYWNNGGCSSEHHRPPSNIYFCLNLGETQLIIHTEFLWSIVIQNTSDWVVAH